MDTGNLRQWLSEASLPTLLAVLEAYADELDGRGLTHAGGLIRDAEVDLLAFVGGVRKGIPT